VSALSLEDIQDLDLNFVISLDVNAPVPTVTLGARDTFKLTFQIAEAQEDKGVQPHQAFLRLSDPVSGEEGVVPIRVTSGGKAKLEIVREICYDLETSTHACITEPSPSS
jgi:hypothetical protein